MAAQLAAGDRVDAELFDGRSLSFRIAEIRETALVGDTSTDKNRGEVVTVPHDEIRRLERVDQHPLALFGRVGAAAVVLVVALLLAF